VRSDARRAGGHPKARPVSERMGILGALLHANAAVIVVASWEERRAWRDEFRSLGVELVRDRVRLAAWDDEKLQEARRWLWWQEHLCHHHRDRDGRGRCHRGGPHRAHQINPRRDRSGSGGHLVAWFKQKIPRREADSVVLREHGFSDDEIWDIAAIAAFFGMSNRLANFTSLRPNDEFYTLGRS
jgi:hypothetical protein